MARLVREGVFWSKDYLCEYALAFDQKTSPLIQLSLFEDGLIFIHDGHHRCVATHLGGRSWLRSDEYVVNKWTYADYKALNPAANWFTPFDPRSTIRLPDLKSFKDRMKKKFAELNDLGLLEAFILENHGEYARHRTLWTVSELAEKLGLSNATKEEAGA